MSFMAFLILLVLIPCMIIYVFGHVSFTQPPHHAPMFPPVGAPAPHPEGHHKGPGGHHPKPPTVAPVHPPVKAPVHPPVKAAVHPPVKAPVHPPTVAPVHPPTKAPAHPPTVAPAHPPAPLPTRKQVAVHGAVVLLTGNNTKYPLRVKGSTYGLLCYHGPPETKAPPPGAVVLLTGNNTKYPLRVKGTTYKNGLHCYHGPPTTKAPPPAHPPTVAPAQPPPPPPTRKQVAVHGKVYCKACKYRGVDTLVAATPLQGAVVLLTCNNTKYPLKIKGTTDKNGFFFIMPPETLTTFGVHKCKVTLLKSSKPTCNHPTNLHNGVKGATPIPTPTPKPSGSVLPVPKLHFDIYTVGPFAYEASKKTPCKL